MLPFLSYIGIIALWGSFLLITLLFFLFMKNKDKYEKIITLYYEKGFKLYHPYLFNSQIGFFGSFNVVYYFICLKKKQRPFLMPDEKERIYHFFDGVPENLTQWMTLFYRISLTAFFCFLLAGVIALIKSAITSIS